MDEGISVTASGTSTFLIRFRWIGPYNVVINVLPIVLHVIVTKIIDNVRKCRHALIGNETG